MAFHYANSAADVVTNRSTGTPAAQVRLTIWTDRDGQRVTAGLRDPEGNTLPGYVESDTDGRYPFTDDAERPYALWALTPAGDWYRLVADELQDQASEVVAQYPAMAERLTVTEGRSVAAEQTAKAANVRSAEAADAARAVLDAGAAIGDFAGLDLLRTQPRFITQLMVDRDRTIQSAVRDAQTGEWYVSQVSTAGSDTSKESVRLYRLLPSGLPTGEEMLLDNGGHGSTIDFDRDDSGNVWIWSGFNEPGGFNLARVKWRTGTVTLASPDVQRIYSTTVSGVFASLDQPNDLIALRLMAVDGAGTSTFVRRSLSGTLAGDHTGGQTVGPFHDGSLADGKDGIMQSFATWGDYFYRLIGFGTPEDPATIEVYDWESGSLLHSLTLGRMGVEMDGTFYDGAATNEPQMMQVYRDRVGRVTLLTSVTVGPVNNRQCKVYGYTQAVDDFGGVEVDALWARIGMKRNGEAHRNAGSNNMAGVKLTDYTRPGWWYFTSGEYALLGDRPTGSSGGFWLHVSPTYPGGSAAIQQLYKLNASESYFRGVNFATPSASGPWHRLSTTNVGP